MNTQRTDGGRVTEALPALYELVAKGGRVVGTFRTAQEPADIAKSAWPNQEQNEDISKGWDIRVVGA